MDILRRSISPITTEAWEAIDQQAKKVLEAHLSCRKFVDVTGPKGWNYSAESLGRLNLYEDADVPSNCQIVYDRDLHLSHSGPLCDR